MEAAFDKEKQRVQSHKNKSGNHSVDSDTITENSAVILMEMEWFRALLDGRLKKLKTDNDTEPAIIFSELPIPELKNKNSAYADLVNNFQLSNVERLFLLCGLIPHIAPEVFTKQLRADNKTFKIEHPELGGYFDATFTNFVPTLQTVLFLLSGDDITNMVYYHLSLRQSVLVREQIITFRTSNSTDDETNERNHIISLAPEYVRYLLSSEKPRPDYGRAFPASHVSTDMEWEDLILNPHTHAQVQEVMNWVKNSKMLNKRKKIRAGFPCLFFGPPGTGKTLTAKLLGKTFGKDVFRVDLSMIVSKYVGETEKNLAHLFDRAENKDCILFFDEADSLFSKRTEVSSSNDKWANLEVSYLLQRMEEYTGLTILATNLKNNLDAAMTRRFQAMIHFPRPGREERKQLWKTSMPEGFSYAKNVSFEKLSKYELTGANISNIMKYCCTQTAARDESVIEGDDLVKGIRRELAKENRTI
jgi:AAA+ superfamily predicted ATPase